MTADGASGSVLERAQETASRLAGNIERVVLGKSDEVRLVVAAFAAGGHVLLEDVPGTAKTVLARSLAASIEGAEIARIQGTPDLQPTDATGLAVFDPASREFVFRPGPLFAHVVLVDEINRAMPRTQSALLEAMAEGQVTVDGSTRPLPDPFLLLATENPIEYEGTFPLPEAQLDRFAVRLALGYPSPEQELTVMREQRHAHPLDGLRPAISLDDARALRAAVGDVYVDDLVERWIVALVRATREVPGVILGASLRGTLSLHRLACARALSDGRAFVTPADVEALFVPVIGHRIQLDPAAFEDVDPDDRATLLDRLWQACLERAPAPRIQPLPGPAASAA
jgi:MoxR-like ATPase